MGLKYIEQPNDSGLCGQCCVAMVANVSLDKAIWACHKAYTVHGTSSSQLINGLKILNIKHDKIKSKVSKNEMFPDFAILGIGDKTNWGHWVVLYYGVVYDPGIGMPLPYRIYENMILNRAYSIKNKAKWDYIIPIKVKNGKKKKV